MNKIAFAAVACTALLYGCALLSGCALLDDSAPCACTEIPEAPKLPCVHPDSSGWAPLFAADLSNAKYDKEVWFIDDQGRLTAKRDDAIWTARDYENFVLDLEYMYDPAANSGVIIYCSDVGNWIPNAVEIQILDDNDPKWQKDAPQNKNGGLYGHLAPKTKTPV